MFHAYEIQALERENRSLTNRLTFLETLLRNNQVHENFCWHAAANFQLNFKVTDKPCTCWLAPVKHKNRPTTSLIRDEEPKTNDYREFHQALNLTPPTES